MEQLTLLLIEDDARLAQFTAEYLERYDVKVTHVADGERGLREALRASYDAVLLDLMLPMKDGLSVCRELRKRYLMPIIMLTARSEEVDRVLGLEVGADDYLVKPFSMRELLARTRAALRRVELEARRGQTAAAGEDVIVHGALRVDPTSHRASIADTELALTPKEFELLLLFAANPGRAFNREFLIERIWGGDYDGFDRAVDNHIRRLRGKLGDVGEKIVTVWGLGYRFIP